MDCRIEAAGDKDDVGRELAYHREEDVIASAPILVIAQRRHLVVVAVFLVDYDAGLPGYVDVAISAGAVADKVRFHVLIPRVEGKFVAAMQRDKQHIGVGEEEALSAVAVVNVPIEDADTLALFSSLPRRKGDVVENAEAS